MIFSKIWRAIAAQFNKMANFFWTADPIAQMQYEYDKAVEDLKDGRKGLEQYRALVERVSRQAATREQEEAALAGLEKKFLFFEGAGGPEKRLSRSHLFAAGLVVAPRLPRELREIGGAEAE